MDTAILTLISALLMDLSLVAKDIPGFGMPRRRFPCQKHTVDYNLSCTLFQMHFAKLTKILFPFRSYILKPQMRSPRLRFPILTSILLEWLTCSAECERPGL
jgi:hypothetical protein